MSDEIKEEPVEETEDYSSCELHEKRHILFMILIFALTIMIVV